MSKIGNNERVTENEVSAGLGINLGSYRCVVT